MEAKSLYELGARLLQEDNLAEAEDQLQRALQIEPMHAGALTDLGDLFARQGRLVDAEHHLRRAYEANPSETRSLQRLTGLLGDQNRWEEAASILQAALRHTPDDDNLHHSLGYVFARLGRTADAEREFRLALITQPEKVETLRNLALALAEQDKHSQLLEISEKLVTLQPEFPTVWLELGRVRRRVKQFEAAAEAFRKAIELQPELAAAHHDLGLTLGDLGDNEGARGAYEQALALNPDFVEAHNNLGVLLEGEGAAEEAITHLRRAVELKDAPDLLNNLGVALAANRDFDEAIEYYQRALAIDAHYAAALNNLGNAQRSLGHVDEAIISLRQALRLRPDYAEAYNNLAIALVQSGRHEEAMRYYNQAIYFRPDYAEAHMNRSLDRLATRDFEAGWMEYEWRWRGKQLRPRFAERQRWDGSSAAGKRILVHFEQGLGDTFQFIRYARVLKQLGATVLAEVQAPTAPLLRTCSDIEEVIVAGEALPPFDVHAPLLSLPGLVGTTLATIPRDIPYLVADAKLVEQWRARLDELPGFKIGIAWQGSPEYRGDRHRSIALKQFARLAEIPGVTLISLQKGYGLEQLEGLDSLSLTIFDDLDTEAGPFMDTAAIIKNLDLVVTSDTSLPHLCGALGAPVWLAIPIACDWRWMHGREDSPWYPTMRVFRQREYDNWEDVFDSIAAALGQRLQDLDQESKEPTDAEAASADDLWDQAVELIGSGKLVDAEAKLLEACRLNPNNARVHHDLGVVRGKQGHPERAIASFRRSLELAPDSPVTWGNLGLAFLDADKIDESISHLQRALALGPNAPETFNNLGVAYMRNSQPDLAVENYQRALRLRPDYAEAHLNLSRALLIQGDLEQGLLEYEWRFRCPGYESREDSKPRWGGEPLAGRTILLHAEQGLGDTLQFARFASLVKRSGGTVLLECQPPLVEILEGCPGVDQIVPRGAACPHYDVYSPLMSLPSLLGISLSTSIPSTVPYLFPREQLVRQWAGRLGTIAGFKVGICWQGNPDYDGDRNRSIQLHRFGPLAAVEGVQLVNLQSGPGSEQLGDRVDGFSVVDFGPTVDHQTGAFMDTAAIMVGLDLVVTSDTAIAHLAGALGVPVWVVVPKAPDFRWLLDREDSPWYPTMRIFRQRTRGDWEEVFKRLSLVLKSQLSASYQVTLQPNLASEIGIHALHEEAREGIRSGNFAEACEQLSAVLKSSPESSSAHGDMGVALARLKRFGDAIAHLRRAVELAPEQPGGYANLGLALLESGATTEAAAVLRAGLKLDPNSPILNKHLGVLSERE